MTRPISNEMLAKRLDRLASKLIDDSITAASELDAIKLRAAAHTIALAAIRIRSLDT